MMGLARARDKGLRGRLCCEYDSRISVSSVIHRAMLRDRRSSDFADAAHGLQLLVAIADGGSFTAAGARLGLTPSAVSKAVTRVEARLGVRLLQRTTRRVAFTDAGEAYIARARQLIADFEGLE